MRNYIKLTTIVGDLVIIEENEKIDEILLPNDEVDLTNMENIETNVLKEAKRQLLLYFCGQLKTFDLPLNIKSTPFRELVYKALIEVEYGCVKTYKEIAESIGNSKASRAVGNANNKNKLPIIIPCHRIIGSNKKLVGYRGGLEIKQKLLQLEGWMKEQQKI